MSSKKLLDEFPPPQQAAKKEGVTKKAYQEQMKEKGREAVAQVQTTGPNAQAAAQLAKIQGPQRIVAELSMAKLDRAIYSQRQLEAVMEDFWYNHFNVFVQKDSDKWLVTACLLYTSRCV